MLVTQRSWKAHNSRRRLPFSFCLPIPKCPMQRGYESCSAPKRALKSSRRFWIGLDYFIAPFRENSMCGSRCPPAALVECSSFFIFSQILTEYVTIETEGVCMYVRLSVRLSVRLCVCLCVCVSATAQTAQPILMKFCTNDL